MYSVYHAFYFGYCSLLGIYHEFVVWLCFCTSLTHSNFPLFQLHATVIRFQTSFSIYPVTVEKMLWTLRICSFWKLALVVLSLSSFI